MCGFKKIPISQNLKISNKNLISDFDILRFGDVFKIPIFQNQKFKLNADRE